MQGGGGVSRGFHIRTGEAVTPPPDPSGALPCHELVRHPASRFYGGGDLSARQPPATWPTGDSNALRGGQRGTASQQRHGRERPNKCRLKSHISLSGQELVPETRRHVGKVALEHKVCRLFKAKFTEGELKGKVLPCRLREVGKRPR